MKIIKIVTEQVVDEETFQLLKSSEKEREEYLSAILTDISMDSFGLEFTEEEGD